MKRLLLAALFLAAPLNAETIRDLAYQGEKLYRASDFRNAIAKWERGIELARTLEDQKLTTYFLANLAVAYADLGDYRKALVYDEEALKVSRILRDDLQTANILGNLGNVRSALGSQDLALAHYEEALAIFRALGFYPGVATILASLGIVHGNLGDFENAFACQQESLELRRALNDRKGVADCLGNRGVLYRTRGDYRKAVAAYEDALVICREIEDRPGVTANLTNIGVACQNTGDYPKAIACFEETLASAKLMGDRSGMGASLANLGIVYKTIGDYPRALSYLERALAYCKETGYTQRLLDANNALGLLYQSLGDYPKALSYYDTSLERARNTGHKPGTAEALVLTGTALADKGGFDEALDAFREALAIQKEAGLPTFETELRIADTHADTGNLELAEKEYTALMDPARMARLSLLKKEYNAAIGSYEGLLRHDLTTREASYLFADHCGMGLGYLGLKEYDDAIDSFKKAIDLTEDQREMLGEGERTRFFSARVEGFRRAEPYERMVQAQIADERPDKAFFYSESLKARSLCEALGRDRAAHVQALPEDLAAEEDNHVRRIRNFRREMQTLYKNKLEDEYKAREKEFKAEKEKFGRFVTKLRKLYPAYASITYPQPVPVNDLPLREDETLIEFEITDDVLYVFVYKGNYKSLNVNTVPKSRKEIQDLVLAYKSGFDAVESEADLASYDPKKGRELYSLLLGDTVDAIAEGSTLIIVPDEVLGILPFESLVMYTPEKARTAVGKHGAFPLGTVYLGNKFTVTYAQSATSLNILRSLPRETPKDSLVLAVCDPVFSSRDSRVSGADKGAGDEEADRMMSRVSDWGKMGMSGARPRGRTAASEERPLFPRLEKTQEVAKTIERLYAGKATALTGAAANEEAVTAVPFSQYKYAVFATHAILDNAVPWINQPALVLSQVGNSAGFDGFLTVSEVMKLKIPCDVVALTACQTGVGASVLGEGVMGMGRAFQYAGCGHVLMSLWPVAEDSTVLLATVFFKKLNEGKEPKEALRFARAQMRKEGYEHPFYWAGFILVSR